MSRQWRIESPNWMRTNIILNPLSGEDKNRAYRNKVQQYSGEETSVWEDVKHGLIYGSKDFVSEIKERFMSENIKEELPQHNSMFQDCDPAALLEKAVEVLGFDLVSACNAKKVCPQMSKRNGCPAPEMAGWA